MSVCEGLTCVGNRDPLVELVVIGHRVKLAALHLSEARLVLLAGFRITGPIAFPFSRAILSSKLWSGWMREKFNGGKVHLRDVT